MPDGRGREGRLLAAALRCRLQRAPTATGGARHRSRRYPMLALNLFGPKEIAVYVAVIVVVLIAAAWFFVRGRPRN
jgi:hypothetical protein